MKDRNPIISRSVRIALLLLTILLLLNCLLLLTRHQNKVKADELAEIAAQNALAQAAAETAKRASFIEYVARFTKGKGALLEDLKRISASAPEGLRMTRVRFEDSRIQLSGKSEGPLLAEWFDALSDHFHLDNASTEKRHNRLGWEGHTEFDANLPRPTKFDQDAFDEAVKQLRDLAQELKTFPSEGAAQVAVPSEISALMNTAGLDLLRIEPTGDDETLMEGLMRQRWRILSRGSREEFFLCLDAISQRTDLYVGELAYDLRRDGILKSRLIVDVVFRIEES